MDILILAGKWLLGLLQGFTAIYLLIPAVMLAIYGFAGSTPSRKRRSPVETSAPPTNFGIIITAYKQWEFIEPLVDSILQQSHTHFHIYVVADNTSHLPAISNEKLSIFQPQPAIHSKVGSIQYAVDRFIRDHPVMMIVDHDNLLHPSMLAKMDRHFRDGFDAVQAQFKPKNDDTLIAKLDAISDVFNFFVEREMRMRLGLHAAIWGSGIAMRTVIYKTIRYPDRLGGFDKMLQYHLAVNTRQIAFEKDAIIYDEKIHSGEALERQRSRWLNAQFKYLKLYVPFFFKSLFRGNFNNAYCAFIASRPPLFILLFLAVCFVPLNWFLFKEPWLAYGWICVLLAFMVSYAGIIFLKTKQWDYVKAAILSPVFAFRQVRSLLQMGAAKKTFLPTTHRHVIRIEEIVSKK
jgi:cellulose synthase/poly-beta-1,6-N-acetylglucosamine synthase-like glycosyltransferase